jgi:hypothetical protein
MNAILALILMSVAAADGSSTAAARPAWVDAEPGLRDGVYETQVLVGPEATREECEKKVLSAARVMFDDYYRRWSESNGYGGPPLVALGMSDDELTRWIIGDKWEEHVKADGADRIFLHVRLRFDAQLQQQWRAAAQASLTERRSIKLTALFLLAMWGVGVTHVALRFDGLLAARATAEAKPARMTRVVLWGTAGLLTAIPLLIVA